MDTKLTKTAIAKELGVSRASLYYTSRQDVKDEQLRQQIMEALHLHPSYGHRRLAIHLNANKKRVIRVMNKYDIKPFRRRGKKPHRNKEADPESFRALLNSPRLQNLIKDYYPVSSGDVWVSDFTYIPFHSNETGNRGFIYLATLMDVYSRRIVGWQVSNKHDTALVAMALYDALHEHGRPNILHSDRGSEYLSRAYRELAINCGIKLSYSAKGSPWENGYQESFYQGFKLDLGDPGRFESVGELVEAIHLQLYIYNNYRIHLSLKMAPLQFLKQNERVKQLVTI